MTRHLVGEFKKLFIYANLGAKPKKLFRYTFIFILIASIAVSAIVSIIFSLPLAVLTLFSVSIFILFLVIFYLWLSLRADKIAREIENVLPDALQLMAMNLKAGMTAEKAILLAARPEFGVVFENELLKASKEVLGGKDIKGALMEMAKRIKSDQFHRTVSILVEGIESGGELSNLLNQISEDLRNQKIVQQDIQTNVMTYGIFIFFAAGIGAPLLYSISTFLVGVLNDQFSRFDVSQTAPGISLFRGDVLLSSEFLLFFSMTAILITSIFSSLIIGVIKSGRGKDGVKFIPILLFISISIFFLVRILVSGAFVVE